MEKQPEKRRLTVYAPASIGNLSVGFDALGLVVGPLWVLFVGIGVYALGLLVNDRFARRAETRLQGNDGRRPGSATRKSLRSTEPRTTNVRLILPFCLPNGRSNTFWAKGMIRLQPYRGNL